MRIKKIFYSCLLLTIMILSACKNNRSEIKDETKSQDDYFEYELEGINLFDAGEDGILYYPLQRDGNVTVYAVDAKGKESGEYLLEKAGNNYIQSLVVTGDKLYYLVSLFNIVGNKPKEFYYLFEYDMQTGIEEEVYVFTEYLQINRIEVIRDEIYFIGKSLLLQSKSYQLYGYGSDYIYSGEVIGKINKDGIIEELPIELPVTFAKTEDDQLMVYAYDNEGGYYLSEYQIEKGELSNKYYHDFGNEFNFESTSPNIVLYCTFTQVCAIILGKDGIMELACNLSISGKDNIEYRNGYVYYLNDNNGGKLERLKASSFMNIQKTVSMIMHGYFIDEPFGLGYMLNKSSLDEDMFALKVLSQDKDYDICLLNSRQYFSDNIKKNSVFYPLNKVEGVKEYLDACFPYVKEAAMTDDGDIWMLPITIDIPVLIYNQETCSKYGMDMSDDMTIEDFLEMNLSIRDRYRVLGSSDDHTLGKDGIYEPIYNIDEYDLISGTSTFMIAEEYLKQYLSENQVFNTEEFRALAYLLKESYDKGMQKWSLTFELENLLRNEKEEKLLYIHGLYRHDILRLLDLNIRDSLNAIGMPKITNSKKNIAYSTFICVNPYSDNLEEALKYISALADYMSKYNDSMMFTDKDSYTDSIYTHDLYSIYENAVITYQAPRELYFDDFCRYLSGKIELEDFIKEADRKLSIYKNE